MSFSNKENEEKDTEEIVDLFVEEIEERDTDSNDMDITEISEQQTDEVIEVGEVIDEAGLDETDNEFILQESGEEDRVLFDRSMETDAQEMMESDSNENNLDNNEEDDGIDFISYEDDGNAEDMDAEGYSKRTMKKRGRRWAIAAGIAGVIVVACFGSVLLLSSLKEKKKPVMADNHTVSTTQNTTQASTSAPKIEEEKPLLGMKLEAVEDETSITAKVLGENGEALAGHQFVINLMEGSLEENKGSIEKLNAVHTAAINAKEAGSGSTEMNRIGASEASSQSATQNSVTAEEVAAQVNAKRFKDEDNDGTVHIPQLNAGTYTLVVQAEEGFEIPNAAEATIVKYTVIEDILDKVVEQNKDTEKEDPQGSRPEPPADNPSKETPPAVTAPSDSNDKKPITVTSVKMSNGKIVYNATLGETIQLTESQISAYAKESVLIENGNSSYTKTGYIYTTGKVEVTDGSVDVIRQILVPKKEADLASTQKFFTVRTSLLTANIMPLGGTVSALERDITDSSTEGTTEPPSTNAPTSGANEYVVINLSPVILTEIKEVIDGWYKDGSKMYYYVDGKPLTGWRLISGINYFFDASGILSSKVVIDVSTYNGNIDWNAVKASGIDYAIIRVGYRGWGTGKLVLDNRFDTNMQGALAAGIKVGAYVVTQAINTAEAVEEASFIIEKCSRYNIALPLAIDVEWAGSSTEEGRANSLSPAERTAIINAYSVTIQNSGYTPMVYANKNWLTNYMHASNIISSCKVWVAQYADIDCTTYGGRFNMWQFRSDGGVNGIKGNVDMNAWLN